MTATAYPLTWPQAFPRTTRREEGRFKTTLAVALKNFESSLRLFSEDSGKKIEGLVISSNVTLGAHRPADPGVAIWFSWDSLQVCIPVDRYTKIESNLQAIHHIIEARRVELRHGTLALVRASFTGFKALPAPTGGWRDVLGFGPTEVVSLADIEAAYKTKRKAAHPDTAGGSADEFDRVQKAYKQALSEVSA